MLEVHMKRAIAAIATASLTAIAALPAAAQPAQSNPTGAVQQPSAQSPGELDMDAVPNLTPDGVRQVQQALQKKGFDPGPLDGVRGPQTKEAVRKFQDFYGIKASGEIDNQTLYALGETQLAGRP
jgi:peptidoglycan hydrolase-like protein with peptidoglycan-binding domain